MPDIVQEFVPDCRTLTYKELWPDDFALTEAILCVRGGTMLLGRNLHLEDVCKVLVT